MSEADTSPDMMKVVRDHEAIDAALDRLAHEIVASHETLSDVALLGILSRGRPLADRLAACIETLTGTRPPVGSLATTLYRDDLRSGRVPATIGNETHFDFDVDGMTVILVDDVIAAGRTVRAALDEVMDYGRPQRIQLACLVDRGHRELPIQPDYLGWLLTTAADDHVAVRIQEIDGKDAVLLEPGARSAVDEESE